jgi:hypothetical protein
MIFFFFFLKLARFTRPAFDQQFQIFSTGFFLILLLDPKKNTECVIDVTDMHHFLISCLHEMSKVRALVLPLF